MKTIYHVLLFVIVGLTACKNSPGNYKPRSIGAPGEVLVVVDSQYWTTRAGQSIRELVDLDFPALPQSESMFRKTQITSGSFENHFKTYRNILVVNIDSANIASRIDYRRDIWALNQQIIEFYVADEAEFVELFNHSTDDMKKYFYNGDIQALVKAYKKSPASVGRHVKAKYGFDIVFPKGYKLKKDTANFSWYVFDRLESQQGLLVYEWDLDSIKSMEPYALISLRNEILHQKVPGPVEGSFMTTEDRFPVLSNQPKFGGVRWMELRGLWRVQGDFMGGPFVSYFYKDVRNNRLVMLDGYVYAPRKQNKALYVREVEAMIKSFKMEVLTAGNN